MFSVIWWKIWSFATSETSDKYKPMDALEKTQSIAYWQLPHMNIAEGGQNNMLRVIYDNRHHKQAVIKVSDLVDTSSGYCVI